MAGLVLEMDYGYYLVIPGNSNDNEYTSYLFGLTYTQSALSQGRYIFNTNDLTYLF